MSQISTRSIIKTFGITSSATFVAIAVSALTNKILSLYVGPEGIGLMGIFRSFGSFLGGTLTFGYTTILVQQMASAREARDKQVIALSGLLLFFFQVLVGILLALFFIRPISEAVFSNTHGIKYALEIKIVIAMALVNILLQVVFALLRGEADIKWLSLVQITTAVSSLVLILPLIRFGSLGLAINVGSGSIVGALMGLYLLRNYFKAVLDISLWKNAVLHLRQRSKSSMFVTIQTLVTVGSLLFVQTRIQQVLGLSHLGNYNAALLVLDTSVLVMMSSVRSYLLPMLAKCDTPDAKAAFFVKFLSVLLSLALLGALAFNLFSPIIIPVLFSSKFVHASSLMGIFGLSLLGLTIVWLYNTLLLHFDRTFAFTVIDCIGACVFISISLGTLYTSPALGGVVWAYALAPLVTALLYLVYTYVSFGSAFVNLEACFIPTLGFLCLGSALSLHTNFELLHRGLLTLATGLAVYLIYRVLHVPGFQLPFLRRKGI